MSHSIQNATFLKTLAYLKKYSVATVPDDSKTSFSTQRKMYLGSPSPLATHSFGKYPLLATVPEPCYVVST
eukprot:scaffold37386_cov69-Cyclotella_meneghiniana.AAC.5